LGAEAFVRWVYAQYSPGSNFDSQTAYSPSLRALFRVNARLNGPGEVGENNDSDEVCQCQEWDQMRLTALGVTPHGTKAEAIASFQDGPQHDTVTLELVQTPAGWRINDVLHPRPGASASLRARLLDETGRLRRAARLRP
jgi:hypothetical protein